MKPSTFNNVDFEDTLHLGSQLNNIALLRIQLLSITFVRYADIKLSNVVSQCSYIMTAGE